MISLANDPPVMPIGNAPVVGDAPVISSNTSAVVLESSGKDPVSPSIGSVHVGDWPVMP